MAQAGHTYYYGYKIRAKDATHVKTIMIRRYDIIVIHYACPQIIRNKVHDKRRMFDP